jgi:hypothetical protein
MRRTELCVLISSVLFAAYACGDSGAKKKGDGGTDTTGADSGKGTSSKDAGTSGTKGGTGGSSSSSSTGGSSGGGKAGASSSSGTGGSSSSGSGGTSSSGTAGSATGSGGTSGATDLPSDGNQLSLCTMAQGECNKGFACYAASSPFSAGRGFCSKVCTMDTDCDGLAPSSAKYTCTTGGGGTHVCEIACTGTDDTMSCPANMTCQQTAPMTQGTMASYRCKYPLLTSAIWGPCGDGTHECEAMMTCAGTATSPSRTGYCTSSCMMDSDCMKPGSGTVTPTCITVSTGGGRGGTMTPPTKLCGLDCAMAMDGCPDGETCVMSGGQMTMGGMTTPRTARCEYK